MKINHNVDQTIEIEQQPIDILNEEPVKIFTRPVQSYKVKITHPNLRKRVDPSYEAEVAGFITDNGIYMITDVVNNWGRLEEGYWIDLQFTERV